MTAKYIGHFKKISLFFSLLFLLNSCEKFYDKTYDDYDFIQLVFNKDADFSKFSTYSMPNSLNLIVDSVYTSSNIDMDSLTNGRYSKEILELVKLRLDQLGLTEVDPSNSSTADLSVVLNSMTVRQVSRYVYMPYYYDPYYTNPNYYYYYPWGIYSYTTNNGLFSIDLVALNNPIEVSDTINKVESIWHGTFEGKIGPTTGEYTDRVLEGINVIFDKDTAFK